MKVLWFSNTPGLSQDNLKQVRGGWISSLEREIVKLKKVELAIAFLGDKSNCFTIDSTSYYEISRLSNSRFKRLIKRMTGKLQDEVALKNLKYIIDDFNPDVIHIHGTENDFGRLLNNSDVPIVFSIQGVLSVYQSKYFDGISRIQLLKKTRPLDFALGKDILTRFKIFRRQAARERLFLGHSAYVIGRTDWDRRVMRILAPKAEYFYGSELLRPEFYKSEWTYSNSDEAVLFSVLGPNVYKGIETLLLAARELKKLEYKFTWFIAGISPYDLSVIAAVHEWNLDLGELNIKLMGKLQASDIVSVMLKSQLYISASHIENSPNNVCEAMLLGMPVIATYAGGTSTLIRDQHNGILIQPGDSTDLAGAIIELLMDSDKISRLGINARKTALIRHSRKDVALQYLEIYDTIVNR